jgi:hypothetical protein
MNATANRSLDYWFKENTFLNVAVQPAILICDRGALDISAYIPTSSWLKVVRNVHTTEAALLDRYDMVCHLVTAGKRDEFRIYIHYSVIMIDKMYSLSFLL